MSKNTKIVGGVLLVAIILVAVAYAAITNVELNINGVGNAQAKQENFKVEFIGTPSTSGKGTTTATINESDKTKGTVNVTGLTAKGDEATATYTVKNLSSDISADLTAEATSSNQTYFEVICSLEKTTLKAQEETTLKVTVRLLKTPIDETKEDLNSDIEVTLTAEPKQPGEETNGGSTSVSSNETRPYLPTGFTQVKGTTLKNGLTIQDSTGNQYVWVEVPKAERVYKTAGLEIKDFTDEEYTKIEDDLHTYTDVYRDGTSYKDEYYSEVGLTNDQYTNLKKTMLKSVYQNGGFYIGKYETGIENKPKTSGSADTAPTETPVIKQNAYPYNYVTCSQAQTLASNMESGNYNTSLMFGVQWDLVLKYLETKGTAQADLKKDSTSWGNYSNNLWNITNENLKYAPNGSGWTSATEKAKVSKSGILLSTGASDDFSKQGIYDLAGNVWEWTLEYTSYSSNACARRGGYYDYYGSSYPAAYRSDYDTTFYNNNLGFRLSLY
mgnify:CR=1 FL=1